MVRLGPNLTNKVKTMNENVSLSEIIETRLIGTTNGATISEHLKLCVVILLGFFVAF